MDNLQLTHERVDDIPLVYGILEKLLLGKRIDDLIGNHGLHQGLSNRYLTVLWLLYVILEGDHRKSGV